MGLRLVTAMTVAHAVSNTSSPAVGSSGSSSCGSFTIACAMPTRRSIPPGRVRSFALALPPSSTCSTAAATAAGTRAAGTSLSSAKYSTNSAIVKPG
jgi:hypothetical protein